MRRYAPAPSSFKSSSTAPPKPIDFFEKVEPLPSSPTLLPKLLNALSDPNINVDEVISLVLLEPILAARVLKLCNSAFFAGGEPTAHIGEAVYRVGFYNVYRLTVTACSQSALSLAQPQWGVDVQNLWNHSVRTALAAELLAKANGEDDGVLFTAGLLHDFGKLIFAGSMRDSYGRLVADAEGRPFSLLKLEREHYQIDHADLGGALLARWNFPEAVVDAVRFHHSPEAAGDYDRLASVLTAADRLAYLMDGTTRADSEIPGLDYVLAKLDFSEREQKGYLNELSRSLNQAEFMSL